MTRRLAEAAVYAAAILLPAWALAGASTADAAPATDYQVCGILAANPTFDGIKGAAAALILDGATLDQAAESIVHAVWITCPEHQRLVRAYGQQGRETWA